MFRKKLWPALAIRFSLALLLAGGVLTALLILTTTVPISADQIEPPASGPAIPSVVGAPLTRIQCVAGYTATIFAEGLAGPDGLAFGPDELLYVVEEAGGRVSRIEANGTTTPVVQGLSKPEGLTFDDQGNLFVVEDIDGGRIVSRTTTGLTGTLASGLEHPEGIVWVADGSPTGILYVTESNLEQTVAISSTNPDDYRTSLAQVSYAGQVDRILIKPALFVLQGPTSVSATFWSYAGLTHGSDGRLYLANELSGRSSSGQITISSFTIDYTAVSEDSIYTVDLTGDTPTDVSFSAGLTAPEGLRFDSAANFPLYVAEEDIDQAGHGRLSQVDAAGNPSPFCTGFGTLEDVIQDQAGRIYVSEDSSGLVILLEPPAAENQAPVAVDDTATTGSDQPVTIEVLANDSDPDDDPLTITALGSPALGLVGLGESGLVYTPTLTSTTFISLTDVFTYQISDGQLTDSATVTVIIIGSIPPPNRAPIAVDDTATTGSDQPVTIEVLANDSDPDYDPLTITALGSPALGLATLAENSVIYTPMLSDTAFINLTDVFTYQISDGQLTDIATVTVTITGAGSQSEFIYLPIVFK